MFDDALVPMESQETPDIDLECHMIDIDSDTDPIWIAIFGQVYN